MYGQQLALRDSCQPLSFELLDYFRIVLAIAWEYLMKRIFLRTDQIQNRVHLIAGPRRPRIHLATDGIDSDVKLISEHIVSDVVFLEQVA